MILHQWATRWGIPEQAIQELRGAMGSSAPDAPTCSGLFGEAAIQQQTRLRAAQRGARLFRNNVGACEDKSGRVIRYGLANDSSGMNSVFKSSDLIGITPVRCSCGVVHGVFTAYECKAANWKYSEADKRSVAQYAFIKFVLAYGGIARFVTDANQI